MLVVIDTSEENEEGRRPGSRIGVFGWIGVKELWLVGFWVVRSIGWIVGWGFWMFGV